MKRGVYGFVPESENRTRNLTEVGYFVNFVATLLLYWQSSDIRFDRTDEKFGT